MVRGDAKQARLAAGEHGPPHRGAKQCNFSGSPLRPLIYICMYVCMYVCMFVCLYVGMYVYMNIYIYFMDEGFITAQNHLI